MLCILCNVVTTVTVTGTVTGQSGPRVQSHLTGTCHIHGTVVHYKIATGPGSIAVELSGPTGTVTWAP